MSKSQQDSPIVPRREEYALLIKDPLYAKLVKVGPEIGEVIVKDSGTTETLQRSCVEEKTEQNGEGTALLEIMVPRGWRDFLLAYPRWKGQNPKIGDSLSEELRAMVSAEVVMLIDEIAVSRPDVAAALVEQYSLQDLDTSVRRSEKEPPVAPPTPEDISLDETLQAIVQHAGWLADRLPVGGDRAGWWRHRDHGP